MVTTVFVAMVLSGCCPINKPTVESMSLPVPLKSGILISGTLWNKPVGSPGEIGGNTGNPVEAGSRIEVYDNFIVVTEIDGTQSISPHGWYTLIKYKQD
jgi:hypothetical protein